ncbi:MAG: hypothetical protein RSB09_02695, partial [Clostridia bacterium]
TRDAKKTNLAVEITDKEGGDKVRAGIYYIGEEEAVFADLSGMLGKAGKIKLTNINLNKIMSELIAGLIDKLEAAINGLGKPAADELANKLADGTIVQNHIAGETAGEGEITDVVGMINAIVDNISIVKDGSIFNIKEVNVELTKSVLDYITKLIFPNGNGNLPITNADIKLVDNGSGKTKNLNINVGIGTNAQPIVGIDLGIRAQFGTLIDKDGFEQTIASIKANKDTFAPVGGIDENGKLALKLDSVQIGIGATIKLDVNALAGKLATVEYNGLKEMLLRILVELGNIDANVELELKANLDIAKLTSGNVLDGVLGSNIYIRLGAGKMTNAVQIWLENKVLYIETTLLGIGKVKIDLAPLLPKTATAAADDAMAAVKVGATNYQKCEMAKSVDGKYKLVDGKYMLIEAAEAPTFVGDRYTAFINASGTTAKVVNADKTFYFKAIADLTDAEKLLAAEESNILPIILALIGGINLYDNGLEVALATGFIANLMSAIGLGDDLKIIIENDDKSDGGILITAGDGLDLTKLNLKVYIGLGGGLDLSLQLGGLNAGVNNMDKHLPTEIDKFYNFFDFPNIFAQVGVGLNLDTNTGVIQISEIDVNQKINIAEQLKLNYYLDLRMSLDLRPVFDYLLGAESIQTKDNKSQIFIELKGRKFEEKQDSILLGLYYVGGKLYLDMGNFGINPVAVDIDLYDMILSLILKGKNSAIQINPSGDAQAAGDTAAVKAKTALEIAVMLSSESLRLEIVKGLSELLFNLVGISAGGIEAALEIAWGNVKENHDGKYLAFDVTVKDTSNHEVGGAQLYIDKLGLGIGQSVEGIKIDRGDNDNDPATPNDFQPLVDYLADRNYDHKADNEFEVANIF